SSVERKLMTYASSAHSRRRVRPSTWPRRWSNGRTVSTAVIATVYTTANIKESYQ
ncbi:hypothetical protein PF005_g32833, partial [Phytophthora fragariae]